MPAKKYARIRSMTRLRGLRREDKGASGDDKEPVSVSAVKERAQRAQGLVGCFLGQEMAARQRMAAHIDRLFAPDRERVIEPADDAIPAPQHEQRALDFLAGVGRVMLEIDRGAGAIILAGGVDGRRIAEAAAGILHRPP